MLWCCHYLWLMMLLMVITCVNKRSDDERRSSWWGERRSQRAESFGRSLCVLSTLADWFFHSWYISRAHSIWVLDKLILLGNVYRDIERWCYSSGRSPPKPKCFFLAGCKLCACAQKLRRKISNKTEFTSRKLSVLFHSASGNKVRSGTTSVVT